MNQYPQLRAPRMEVSGALPLIPAGMWAQSNLFSDGGTPATVRHFAASAMSRLGEKACRDEVGAKAVMTLLDADGASAPDRLERVWEAVVDGGMPHVTGSQLYERATQLLGRGHCCDAVHVLAVLAGSDPDSWQALLGLAVIALQCEHVGIARDLASMCLSAPDRHPRTLSVMGVCALDPGDRRAAQAHLAAAARLARGRPLFRSELQIAQRALLLMHLM